MQELKSVKKDKRGITIFMVMVAISVALIFVSIMLLSVNHTSSSIQGERGYDQLYQTMEQTMEKEKTGFASYMEAKIQKIAKEHNQFTKDEASNQLLSDLVNDLGTLNSNFESIANAQKDSANTLKNEKIQGTNIRLDSVKHEITVSGVTLSGTGADHASCKVTADFVYKVPYDSYFGKDSGNIKNEKLNGEFQDYEIEDTGSSGTGSGGGTSGGSSGDASTEAYYPVDVFDFSDLADKYIGANYTWAAPVKATTVEARLQETDSDKICNIVYAYYLNYEQVTMSYDATSNKFMITGEHNGQEQTAAFDDGAIVLCNSKLYFDQSIVDHTFHGLIISRNPDWLNNQPDSTTVEKYYRPSASGDADIVARLKQLKKAKKDYFVDPDFNPNTNNNEFIDAVIKRLEESLKPAAKVDLKDYKKLYSLLVQDHSAQNQYGSNVNGWVGSHMAAASDSSIHVWQIDKNTKLFLNANTAGNIRLFCKDKKLYLDINSSQTVELGANDILIMHTSIQIDWKDGDTVFHGLVATPSDISTNWYQPDEKKVIAALNKCRRSKDINALTYNYSGLDRQFDADKAFTRTIAKVGGTVTFDDSEESVRETDITKNTPDNRTEKKNEINQIVSALPDYNDCVKMVHYKVTK